MGFVRFCSILVLASCAFIVTTATTASAADKIHLVHHDPANYPQGYPFVGKAPFPAGRYFALHCDPDCVFDAVDLRLKKSMVATTEDREPGVLSVVRGARRPAFLLRGLPGLKAGPVKTWYVNRRFLDSKGDEAEAEASGRHERRFDIDGRPLVLTGLYSQVKEEPCTGADCPTTMRAVWRLRFGEIERTIATLNGDAIAGPLGPDDFVVWIGDLDGDGRPDLVARTSNRGDSMDLSLFLSSALEVGKPWRPSAAFSFWDPENPGC